MNNTILASLVSDSKEGLTLHDYDWKSLNHAIIIHFEQNGWKEDPTGTFINEHCKMRFTDKEKLNGEVETNVSGTCDDDFDFMTIIREIINLHDNRYVVLSGKITIVRTEKVDVVTIDKNDITIKTATFDEKVDVVTIDKNDINL